jgi:hypothetical protein
LYVPLVATINVFGSLGSVNNKSLRFDTSWYPPTFQKLKVYPCILLIGSAGDRDTGKIGPDARFDVVGKIVYGTKGIFLSIFI